MRAAGAHASTYHGPLQQLVMCACHRTSPTAATLGPDGLYSATSAEQRGQNLPKLLAFKLATGTAAQPPPCDLHAGARTHSQSELSRFAPARVRRRFAPRKRRLYRTLRSWNSQIIDNAAALAARAQEERLRGGGAA